MSAQHVQLSSADRAAGVHCANPSLYEGWKAAQRVLTDLEKVYINGGLLSFSATIHSI